MHLLEPYYKGRELSCGDLIGGNFKVKRYSHSNYSDEAKLLCRLLPLASDCIFLGPVIGLAFFGRRLAGEDAELVMATQAPGQRQGQAQGQAQSLPSYCLNLSKIVQLAQMKELQGVVQRQFGVHGDSPVRLCA